MHEISTRELDSEACFDDDSVMGNLFFEVKAGDKGDMVAACLTEEIVAQAADFPALKIAVTEAVTLFFAHDPEKAQSTIHYVA